MSEYTSAKSCLLILLFLSISLAPFSSTAQASKFNVGADIFPNISMNFGERGQYEELSTPKLSASFGLVLTYQHRPKVAFETGLKYLNKGQKRNDLNQPNFVYTFNDKLYFERDMFNVIYNYNYLSVPLMVRFAFGESTDKGWYVRMGLAPTLYLSSKITFEFIDNEGITRPGVLTNDTRIRETVLNLNYGLGYAFLFKEKYQISVEPGWEFMLYRSFYEKHYHEIYHSLGVNFRFMGL